MGIYVREAGQGGTHHYIIRTSFCAGVRSEIDTVVIAKGVCVCVCGRYWILDTQSIIMWVSVCMPSVDLVRYSSSVEMHSCRLKFIHFQSDVGAPFDSILSLCPIHFLSANVMSDVPHVRVRRTCILKVHCCRLSFAILAIIRFTF